MFNEMQGESLLCGTAPLRAGRPVYARRARDASPASAVAAL